MRRVHWIAIVLPWLALLQQGKGPGSDARPPVVGEGGGEARASGSPVRGRVLVPPVGGEGGEVELLFPALPVGRPLVDEAWLVRLDRRLGEDLDLLVAVLGGEALRPELERRLRADRELPVAERIVAKEALLRDLLEVAADE